MTLKTKLESVFGNEERAVSPVIGVILMVAITVILAAVIATFVLDLGGDQQNAPQANFQFDGDASGVTVTHGGGDTVNMDNVELKGPAYTGTGGSLATGEWSAGSNTNIAGGDLQAGTLQLVWTGPNGQTSVIGTYEVR